MTVFLSLDDQDKQAIRNIIIEHLSSADDVCVWYISTEENNLYMKEESSIA